MTRKGCQGTVEKPDLSSMGNEAIFRCSGTRCVAQILRRTWPIQVIQDVGKLLAHRSQVRVIPYLYRFTLHRLYMVEKPETYPTVKSQFVKRWFTGEQMTDVIEVTEVVGGRRRLRKSCKVAPLALVERGIVGRDLCRLLSHQKIPHHRKQVSVILVCVG